MGNIWDVLITVTNHHRTERECNMIMLFMVPLVAEKEVNDQEAKGALWEFINSEI